MSPKRHNLVNFYLLFWLNDCFIYLDYIWITFVKIFFLQTPTRSYCFQWLFRAQQSNVTSATWKHHRASFGPTNVPNWLDHSRFLKSLHQKGGVFWTVVLASLMWQHLGEGGKQVAFGFFFCKGPNFCGHSLGMDVRALDPAICHFFCVIADLTCCEE